MNLVHDALIAALEKVVKRDCILLTTEKCGALTEYLKCASHFLMLTIVGAADTPYECYFTIHPGRRIDIKFNYHLPRGVTVLDFASYELFAGYWAALVDTDLRLYCE